MKAEGLYNQSILNLLKVEYLYTDKQSQSLLEAHNDLNNLVIKYVPISYIINVLKDFKNYEQHNR